MSIFSIELRQKLTCDTVIIKNDLVINTSDPIIDKNDPVINKSDPAKIHEHPQEQFFWKSLIL